MTKTTDFSILFTDNPKQTIFVHSFIPLKIIAIVQVEKEQ